MKSGPGGYSSSTGCPLESDDCNSSAMEHAQRANSSYVQLVCSVSPSFRKVRANWPELCSVRQASSSFRLENCLDIIFTANKRNVCHSRLGCGCTFSGLL